MRAQGFEPWTYGLKGRCSTGLSYALAWRLHPWCAPAGMVGPDAVLVRVGLV